MSFLNSEEFKRLEANFPFLRHARQGVQGMKQFPYIIVDIETTGLDPTKAEIIEVAALKVEKGEIREVFNHLIKIDFPLPSEIVQITGLSDELLADGEPKEEVLRQLIKFLGQETLVAHNAEFDLPFIKYHLKTALNAGLANQELCTLKLARKLVPGCPSYKLQKVAEYFQIPTPVLHRAIADAEITYQLWLKLIELLDKRGIKTIEDAAKLM